MAHTIALWCGCLASYNQGILYGEWIDLNPIDTTEELQEAIDYILKSSPIEDAEEWAWFDHDLGGIHIDEYEDLEEIINIAKGLKEHESAFVAFYNCFCSTDLEEFEERYQGEYDSVEDYAQQFLEDTGAIASIPENLRYYFDYEKYANDLEISGDINAEYIDDKCHIFFNY